MSLTRKGKDQQAKPTTYVDEYDDIDLKVRLNQKNLGIAEVTIADLLICGFFRSELTHAGDIPMRIVFITSKLLNKSAHLPDIVNSILPLRQLFNKEVLDLKTPKFSNLSVSARTVLRIFLQWRLNVSTEIYNSPKANVRHLILSGNDVHFGYKGCFWVKQVLPYHPEIEELDIDHNNINDEGLQLIIHSLSVRHDASLSTKSLYPVKQLMTLNLSNNQFTHQHLPALFESLSTYTPKLRSLDLSYNNLGNECCTAIADFLKGIDAKNKKDRCLRVINLRHNEIDSDGVEVISDALFECHERWNIKIELGSNPTKELYTFDTNEATVYDSRINLHGA